MKTRNDHRRNRIRSRALELLRVAGYVDKARFKQAIRIAIKCEKK